MSLFVRQYLLLMSSGQVLYAVLTYVTFQVLAAASMRESLVGCSGV